MPETYTSETFTKVSAGLDLRSSWPEYAFLTAVGLFLYMFLFKLPAPLYFLPATIYIFFGFRLAGLDGSHRSFSPVFILIAIWLLLKGKGLRNLALAGGSLAVASFFTQQRGFVVLAAILAFLLIE